MCRCLKLEKKIHELEVECDRKLKQAGCAKSAIFTLLGQQRALEKMKMFLKVEET